MPHQDHNNPQGSTLTNELEEYAQLYLKYAIIIEDQTCAIRRLHTEKGIKEAHSKVSEEHYELKKLDSPLDPSIEELLHMLKYYGELAEIPPKTLHELS